MVGKKAKILSNEQTQMLIEYALATRKPVRNQAIVLLAFKAGLRAGEIANLTWDMIVGPAGDVGPIIELRDWAAKNHKGRIVPVHPDLRDALNMLRMTSIALSGPVIVSERGGGMTATSVVNWFAAAFRTIGLEGCSSHSGRRTFITRAARLIHHAGGSLRDVQLLAGHRSIETTQRYIDGDTDVQRKVVSLI
jgi:integrase